MKVKLCTNSDLKINLHLNEYRIPTINDADVAQLGEHETEDLRVAGSIPAISTFLISFKSRLQMRYSTFLKK